MLPEIKKRKVYDATFHLILFFDLIVIIEFHDLF